MSADKLIRVSCPFNPVHVVERRRLQAHIIKCKRNLPPGHDFVQCNFWYMHYIRKSELEAHYKVCEHRLQREADELTWSTQPAKFNAPKLIHSDGVGQPLTEENWEDCSAPSFDPEKLRKSALHMPVPEGLTKSQRKEYVEAERRRLREIEEKSALDLKKAKTDASTAASSTDAASGSSEVHPRVPGKVVQRLGRIAARFPDACVKVEPEERSRADVSSSSSYYTAVGSEASTVPRTSRGRGLLGWSQDERSPRFSPRDFPELK